MKTIKNIYPGLLLAAILFLIIAPAGVSQTSQNQQSEAKQINKMVEKLKAKLLLNDTQVKSLETILEEYFSEVSKLTNSPSGKGEIKPLRDAADTKISKLLDSRQKMKFSIIHDEWWNLATN